MFDSGSCVMSDMWYYYVCLIFVRVSLYNYRDHKFFVIQILLFVLLRGHHAVTDGFAQVSVLHESHCLV